jgi:hypothetical protein
MTDLPAKFKLAAVNNMPHSGKPDELVDGSEFLRATLLRLQRV